MHGHRYSWRFRKEAWPFIAMMAASKGGPWGGSGFGAGWGGWDGEGMRRGPGRRRGRMFAQGELRLVLLKLIADQPRHGYELIKAIEELTGGSYSPSPGTIYPTLQLLADEGMIAEDTSDATARKPFAATQDGRDELLDKESEVAALFDRLSDHGDREAGAAPRMTCSALRATSPACSSTSSAQASSTRTPGAKWST